MTDFWTNLKNWEYFNELAFVVAIFLLLWAWKFAIEGIVEGMTE